MLNSRVNSLTALPFTAPTLNFMTTLETASRKKPLRRAWWIVIPAVLLALFCVFFGSHLRRELIVRRLERFGADVHFRHIPSTRHPLQVIPGFEHFQAPVLSVEIRIADESQAACLPQLLRDVCEISEFLQIDLSGSKDLSRDLGLLPADMAYLVQVSDREISRSALNHLGRLAKLKSLALQGCKIDNDAFSEIGQLKQLLTLYLDGSSISDEGLRHLHGLTKLYLMSLSNTQASESAKEALCKALPKLDLSDD